MRVLVGAVAVLAAGCFTKPDRPELGGGGGSNDAGTDGPSKSGDGSMTGPCTLHDDFNLPDVGCGSWAMLIPGAGNPSITHGPSTLSISGGASGGSIVCASVDTIDVANGVTVDIVSTPTEANSVVRFEVIDALSSTRVALRLTGKGAGAQPTAELQHSNNTVTGTMTFLPDTMKTWRLHTEVNVFASATPATSSTDVVLEYSADGVMWNELGRENVGQTKFTTTSVHLYAAFASASSVPAVFDNLDGCHTSL